MGREREFKRKDEGWLTWQRPNGGTRNTGEGRSEDGASEGGRSRHRPAMSPVHRDRATPHSLAPAFPPSLLTFMLDRQHDKAQPLPPFQPVSWGARRFETLFQAAWVEE